MSDSTPDSQEDAALEAAARSDASVDAFRDAARARDDASADASVDDADATPDSTSDWDWDPTWIVQPEIPDTPEAQSCLSSYANQDFDEVLAACPQFTNSMVWTSASGATLAYSDWNYGQKSALRHAFDEFIAGRFDVPATCPDPVQDMDPNFQFSGNAGPGFVTADAAFDIYSAYVAHALFVEVTHAVPWSLLSLPAVELSELFASTSYHSLIRPSDNALPNHILAGRDFQMPFSYEAQRGRMCRPHDAYAFVRGVASTSHRDMVGNGSRETLAHLTLWAADNVAHGPMPANMQLSSGFPFYIRDLLKADDDGVIIARLGCHSLAAMLSELARSVNIPLLNVATVDFGEGYFGSRTHRGLVVGWGGDHPRVLQHADDIYAVGLRPFLAAQPIHTFSSDVARKYAETTWLAPSTLTTRGYLIASNYPPVTPGVGVATGSPPPEYESRYDYGRVLGTWPFNVSGRSVAWQSYTSEQEERLCSSALTKTYCDLSSMGGGPSDFQFVLSGSRPNLANLDVATRAWNRLAGCMSRAGGCVAANALLAEYPEPKHADTSWLDPL